MFNFNKGPSLLFT